MSFAEFLRTDGFIKHLPWLFLKKIASYIAKEAHSSITNNFFKVDMIYKILEFVFNSIEKVKPVFLPFSMCIFFESNGTKSYFPSFHRQNSRILQTRMGQRGNPMKMNFDNFFFFFFYLCFLSRTFTIHRTVREGGGYLFNSSLPLLLASHTLRH